MPSEPLSMILKRKCEYKEEIRKEKNIRQNPTINYNIQSDLEIDKESEGEEISSDYSSETNSSIDKINCFVCESGDNDELCLVCDRCNCRGCHIYCLIPPLKKVPSDEWFCDECKKIVDVERENKRRWEEIEMTDYLRAIEKKVNWIIKIE